MEFQPITPPQTLYSPPSIHTPSSKKKRFVLVALAGLLLVLVALVIFIIRSDPKNSDETATRPLSILSSIPFLTNILKGGQSHEEIFLTSLPRPLEKITLEDIPSYFDVNNVVPTGNTLWIASQNFLIEYDISKKSLVRVSDPKKVGECDDVVMVAAYLYTACRNSAGEYSVYKINSESRKLAQKYSMKDGLTNARNVKLFAAADAVWIATAAGVGRLDIASNTIIFFDDELGTQTKEPAVANVVFDGNFVWAVARVTNTSKGGVAVYDKTAKNWKFFGPSKLQDRERDKIEIEGIKPVQGGLQIAFRDGRIKGTIRLVEKVYSYSTQTWSKISDRPTTGNGGEATYLAMRQDYPQDPIFTTISPNGLGHLTVPTTGQLASTDGRRNYILSPMIHGKRYLLTSATVDVIDTASPFNRILIRLSEGIELHQRFPDPRQYQTLVEFKIDPQSMLGLIIDSGCDPRTGCGTSQKAWLVDLKKEVLLRTYTQADGLPSGRLLKDISFRVQNGQLDVFNKIGIKLFSINTSTLQFTTIFTSPQAAPTSDY